VDRLTRHELKSDQLVEKVGQIVDTVEEHRSQVIRYGVIAVAALVLMGGGYWYRQRQMESREAGLTKVLRTWTAPVGGAPGDYSFASPESRNQALVQAVAQLTSKHGGSNEAGAANYVLGVQAADAGKEDEAIRYFKQAVADGGREYGALGKLALADLYAAQGNPGAEKLYKELIEKPTPLIAWIEGPVTLVSRDTATIGLARFYLSKGRIAEARTLLDPYKGQTNSAARQAITVLAESYSAGK